VRASDIHRTQASFAHVGCRSHTLCPHAQLRKAAPLLSLSLSLSLSNCGAGSQVSAGTNNARVASQLRSLSSYYYKEPSLLFLLRCAQGLTHMGKGLLTLNPYHSDKLMSNTAMAGLLATVFCGLDMKATVLTKYHHVLYYLVAAMQPRMLMTLDEDMKPLPVTVRVGQSVDVVGQAGRPKTITGDFLPRIAARLHFASLPHTLLCPEVEHGAHFLILYYPSLSHDQLRAPSPTHALGGLRRTGFQTHTTPVLLATGDRAELATDKYVAVTPILEGCVILKLNPDYDEPVL
jgi:hypothetical protein